MRLSTFINTHVWWCTEIGLDGWRIDIAHETYRKYIWDQVLIKCYNAENISFWHLRECILRGISGVPAGVIFLHREIWKILLFSWENPKAEYGSMKNFNGSTEADPYDMKDISSHRFQNPICI